MDLGGRPVIYTEEAVRQICDKLTEYTNNTTIPIIAKFAGLNNITRQRLYEFAKSYDWFSDAMKKCTDKKEAALEEMALSGDINVSMAIFSLKQLGWSDKTQTEISGPNGGAIEVNLSAEEKLKLIAEIRNDGNG